MINIIETNKKLINKEFTAEELLNQCIDKIERYDHLTNSILTKNYEVAMDKAKEVDKKIIDGKDISIIAGIPFGVKDNLETKDLITTAGSKFYENYKPSETAFCVEELVKNDAVLIGKLNLDEFGVGDITKSFKYTSKNPYNLNYDASGSSGGSSIFVASGYGGYSIGTDTGGSIREPAGKTGVVGIKPTYNCISKTNCYGYASSLDTLGSIASNILDMAITMEYMTVFDKNDKNFVFVDYKDAYKKATVPHNEKIHIATIKEINEIYEIDNDEMQGYFDLVEELKKSDKFIVDEVSIPNINKTSAMYKVVTAVEGNTQFINTLKKYHSYDEIAQSSLLFDKRVRQRIMLGEYYKKHNSQIIDNCRKAIDELNISYNDNIKNYDCILAPLTSYHEQQNIVTLANFTKSPCIALPVGLKSNKVPYGIQLFGKHKKDVELIKYAYNLEQFIGFNSKPDFKKY